MADTIPTIRIIGAFVAAPVAGMLVLLAGVSVFADTRMPNDVPGYMLYSLTLVGFPATLVLGVPFYFLLKSRVRPSPISCGSAGAAVVFVYLLIFVPLMRGSALELKDAGFLAVLTGVGFVSGLVFWLVATKQGSLTA